MALWEIPTDRGLYTSTTGDFSTDAALGLIPGLTTKPIVTGTNPDLNGVFEDIWDAGALLSWPTSAETWEAVSDDVNDTSAGTGLRTLLVTSLDANYDEQLQVVTMNGTTPVALTGTHIRTIRITGISSGSSEANAGTITLRVASAGATRQQMRPTEGTSFSSFYTTPADRIALIYQTFADVPKGEDVEVRSRVRLDSATPIQLTGGALSLYQNNLVFPLTTLGVFGEKTDFWLQAKSTNPSVTVTAGFEVMEIDSSVFAGDITSVMQELIV